MNKHERAVELIGGWVRSFDNCSVRCLVEINEERAASLTYALRVLEAVEGVEEWMPGFLQTEAKKTSDDLSGWNLGEGLGQCGAAFQAILDAKGEAVEKSEDDEIAEALEWMVGTLDDILTSDDDA